MSNDYGLMTKEAPNPNDQVPSRTSVNWPTQQQSGPIPTVGPRRNHLLIGH
jgi:hypothetical protein